MKGNGYYNTLLIATNFTEVKVSICLGTSLAVQWLGLLTSTAGGAGSIPGQGTKILHAAWPKNFLKKSL